ALTLQPAIRFPRRWYASVRTIAAVPMARYKAAERMPQGEPDGRCQGTGAAAGRATALATPANLLAADQHGDVDRSPHHRRSALFRKPAARLVAAGCGLGA